MEFEVLGPLRVRSEDGGRELRVRAQHGLLAVLLTSPNVAISDDRLIDELWGDDPPASARHVLQVYASELRGILGQAEGPRILRDGNGRWLAEPCGKGACYADPSRSGSRHAQGSATGCQARRCSLLRGQRGRVRTRRPA